MTCYRNWSPLADERPAVAGTRPGTERFWTSGSPEQVQSVVAQLWTNDVDVQGVPSAFLS